MIGLYFKDMVRKFIVCCLLALCLGMSSYAQMAKTAFVTGKEPFTDNIEMSKDMKDTDLIVKFIFNEGANTLTVRLISYRGLFVFRDDVRYGQVVTWLHLRPEKFPYPVKSDKKNEYYVTDRIRQSIKGTLGKQLFHRWVQYDGLQPVPCEYNMVNDVIEQTFDIQQKRSVVQVTLRDIFLMDPGKQEGKYSIVYWKDLNLHYDVAIIRDACFGKEQEISAAKLSYDGIRASTDSDCDCIYTTVDAYNMYVDSIARMEVKMPAAAKAVVVRGISPQSLLSKAQKLDINVSRWLASGNAKEKRDIERECVRLINAGNSEIDSKGVYTAEQKDAKAAFKRAEAYFNKTCGR